MNILIIEDEDIAYKNLVNCIKEIDGTLQIKDWKTSVKSAIEYLKNKPHPDLIFLDIQLTDGVAFDIFEEVDTDIPVIFTTAYDEYAIKAFEINSIDYLLKPIRTEKLKKSLDKFKKMSLKRFDKYLLEQVKFQITNSINNNSFKNRFLTKVGDKYFHIETKDIAYFFADGNLVFAVTKNRRKSIVNYSLKEINLLINPKDFFQIARNYIVNISEIDKVVKYFGSRLKLYLKTTGRDLIISKARVSKFLEWMEDVK